MATDKSIWQRLTRLFRSGPVIRHKVAASTPDEPIGTASAYKREISSLYVNALASYGQYERLARYADYGEMEYTPEIASALDIYADESTTKDEDGKVLTVTSPDAEIQEILEDLFYEILDINFHIWSWVRNLCKYGDMFLMIDASEANGVIQVLPIPVNELEREEGYAKDDPFAVRFRWLTQGNKTIQNWQIAHFRLIGNDAFLPYGQSVIEPARRIWRQLILIEDAMLVYRIVRSPERRVFTIPVGNLPSAEVDQYIEKVKTNLKRNTVVDKSTGRVDLRYNPMSVDEDIFLPRRGDVGPTVENLPGGQMTGDIEDVQYIQNKLFAALKVPKAYLGYEEGIGSKSTLAQEDVRFSRTIERVHKIVISEFNKLAIVHLFLLGYDPSDAVNFKLEMANPSTIAEQQQLELWRMRLEVATSATEGVLDQETIYKHIFRFSPAKIAKVREGKKLDKLEQLALEAMTAPGGGPEAEGEGAEEPVPGEEELPDTLGGAEPEPPGEPPPENASVAAAGPVISEEPDETFNRGSQGDDAALAVDKGKDLFSTSEDPLSLTLGTEKQTASDPFDLRAQRRLVTRPFSETPERVVALTREIYEALRRPTA